MRALANYVMKGRSEAVMVAALATGSVLFAWVGAAVVALVTLRKGFNQGSYVLLWAMLPAVVMAAMGDTGPVTTLLGVLLAASVLKSTASWPMALMTAVISGVVTGLALLFVGQGYIEEVLRLLNEILVQLASQSGEQSALALMEPTASQVAGLFGLSNAFTVTLCLLLARWWQALLYNPGGFQQEFHALRLPPLLTVGLLCLGLLLSSMGSDYRIWAVLFAMPILFAGFALMHGVAAKKQLSANWIGLFYFCWLLFDPLKALLLVAAIADSWLNIRGRLGASQSSD
jgi:hypothetical protein